MNAVEIKAFVPTKDFELAKQFYIDLGFSIPWSDNDLAYVLFQDCSFFLQNFYVEEHAENFVMHLMVDDADAWWANWNEKDIVNRYGVFMSEPKDEPWKMRDFHLIDPTGVLWHIAHNI
ncbi:VOC family protein [Flavobacterium sp. '19STA2R22 D10 B1']|uniref:VOC family protein n=1 Tax=Flavobacterium aerium TaxID=3037261 RepID=UPI00278C3EFC|nr:VOC family protein [Flavobacterium sp. '19STA2R22 D10 B1']